MLYHVSRLGHRFFGKSVFWDRFGVVRSFETSKVGGAIPFTFLGTCFFGIVFLHAFYIEIISFRNKIINANVIIRNEEIQFVYAESNSKILIDVNFRNTYLILYYLSIFSMDSNQREIALLTPTITK